jgi:uncharacterized membrane protein
MAIQFILILLYMVVTHLAVVLPSDRLALISINLLALIVLLGPLKKRQPWAYLAMAAMVAMLYFGSGARLAQVVIFLPPIVVNVGLCWLFGHTLLGERTPLVVRMVRLLHGKDDLTDQMLRYARRVTAIWTGLFLFNAVVCLVLALCATPGGLLLAAGYRPMFTVPVRDWSLFSDIGCNVLVGLLFVVEYTCRRRLFPRQPYRNFFDFLQRAAAIGPALFADLMR